MSAPRRTALATLVAVVLLAAPVVAAPDDASLIGLRVRGNVEHGKQKPAVILVPEEDATHVVVSLEREDGKKLDLRAGTVKAGREVVLEFDQPAGAHSYKAVVRGRWKRGKDIAFGFDFTATSLAPLFLDVTKKDVDLENARMRVKLSRDPGKVELEVIGDGGKVLDRVETEVRAAAGEPFDVSWKKTTATIEKISVRVHDRHGFWAGVDVLPFNIHIPHDEVEFEFGKADVRASEESKLTATLAQLRDALEKHGREIEIQLYIAGYTDTVGSPSANIELSDRRAKAIAGWFRGKGITIPIFYQGFGESALAVETPDDTPEARNRRALYILSAGLPIQGDALPFDRWKKL